MNSNEKKIQNKLSILFWVNIIGFLIVFVLLVIRQGGKIGEVDQHIVAERYAIILVLAGIPLTLKWFHWQYKKIREKDIEQFAKLYYRYSIIRMLCIDVIIITNMIGAYFLGKQNFIYMCFITIFALAFTFPNRESWNINIVDETQDSINNK